MFLAPMVLCWLVDPLIKVFADATPGGTAEYRAEVARGETAEWQVVVRSAAPLDEFSIKGASLGNLGNLRVRFVGTVPVDKLASSPSKDALRKAPADFPDPLFTEIPKRLEPNRSYAFWIDIKIPVDAKPGRCSARIDIAAQGFHHEMKLDATIYGAKVAKTRLWLTNWFVPTIHPMTKNVSPDERSDDDAFFKNLGTLARNMADHHQNVAMISALNLADIKPDGDFDFHRFDRWVETFQNAGVIGRIEGGHLGGRVDSGWESPIGVDVKALADGKIVTQRVKPDTPEADAFYSRFLPQLAQHLKEKGWFGAYLQHVADEPIDANQVSYKQAADLVRRFAPGMRIIDANQTQTLAGSIDVWVPETDFLRDNLAFYESRKQQGDELWFYTCIYPQGEMLNRFIELPLLKTRLLQWQNYRYGATGYLHWGFNWWQLTGDPFHKTTVDAWGGGDSYLPSGDSCIVYPGENELLDSIRWEALRDGVADYELLAQLGERDAKYAAALAARLVQDFLHYDLDVTHFRNARRELLKAVSAR